MAQEQNKQDSKFQNQSEKPAAGRDDTREQKQQDAGLDQKNKQGAQFQGSQGRSMDAGRKNNTDVEKDTDTDTDYEGQMDEERAGWEKSQKGVENPRDQRV